MQSEKKYKTKAAQEYRKHIHKIQLEESGHGSTHASSSPEAPHAPVDSVTTGLDRMMLSFSQKEEDTSSNSTVPVTVFSSLPVPTEAAQTPTSTPTPPPQAKGALDVSNALSAPSDSEAPAQPLVGTLQEEDAGTNGLSQQQLMKQLLGKKGKSSAAKASGARKLGVTSSEKLESFEAVERRRQQQLQEEADRKLALTLQAQESGGSGNGEGSSGADFELTSTGRVAAALSEESASSKYRNSPSSSSASAAATSSIYRNSSSSSSSSAAAAANESRLARERYGSQKGISSDQFFGRDQEDDERARLRLQQLSGSSSISSDMIYSNSQNAYSSSSSGIVESTWSSFRSGTGSGAGSSSGASGNALNKLSESVAGFFDEVQKRIG